VADLFGLLITLRAPPFPLMRVGIVKARITRQWDLFSRDLFGYGLRHPSDALPPGECWVTELSLWSRWPYFLANPGLDGLDVNFFLLELFDVVRRLFAFSAVQSSSHEICLQSRTIGEQFSRVRESARSRGEPRKRVRVVERGRCAAMFCSTEYHARTVHWTK
jgi:hypothetical protein